MDLSEHYEEQEKESARKRLHKAAEEMSEQENYLRLNREMGALEEDDLLSWREEYLQHRNGFAKAAVTIAKKVLPESEIKSIMKSAQESGRKLAWAQYIERSDKTNER